MTPRTSAEVFVDAVRDHLEGTPNASHPVQFVSYPVSLVSYAACTLCGSLVINTDKWINLHRTNHDDHNRVHANIEAEARRYVPEPRYG